MIYLAALILGITALTWWAWLWVSITTRGGFSMPIGPLLWTIVLLEMVIWLDR